jgi:hypothetical protein
VKLTRQEILLLATLLTALTVGGFVQKFRAAHPVNSLTPKPISKK